MTGRIAINHVLVLALGVNLLAGCKEEQRGPDRDPTFPITGQVFVDGKPVQFLQVKAQPIAGTKAHVLSSAAFTDQDGKFSIGTYEGGDGAPLGEFGLTFMWGNYSMLSQKYAGPDKLNKKYLDPEKSAYKVKVEPGSKNELGKIELTTGAPAK